MWYCSLLFNFGNSGREKYIEGRVEIMQRSREIQKRKAKEGKRMSERKEERQNENEKE